MCNTLNIKALELYCNIKKWNIELDTLKNKSHLFLSTQWIATKTHDETPQKLQIKRIKNYK